MAACIICNKDPHDPRCSYVLNKGEGENSELDDNERELYQERAIELYNNPDRIEELLDIASLVGIQKLIKSALLPTGKDPAITSIRAISAIVDLNTEWTRKQKAKNTVESKVSKRVKLQ
jgi:hypothetical protein